MAVWSWVRRSKCAGIPSPSTCGWPWQQLQPLRVRPDPAPLSRGPPEMRGQARHQNRSLLLPLTPARLLPLPLPLQLPLWCQTGLPWGRELRQERGR